MDLTHERLPNIYAHKECLRSMLPDTLLGIKVEFLYAHHGFLVTKSECGLEGNVPFRVKRDATNVVKHGSAYRPRLGLGRLLGRVWVLALWRHLDT